MSPYATQTIKCDNENDDGVAIPITIISSSKSTYHHANMDIVDFYDVYSKVHFNADSIPITANKLISIENTFLRPSPELLQEMMLDAIGFCGDDGLIDSTFEKMLYGGSEAIKFWRNLENEIHFLEKKNLFSGKANQNSNIVSIADLPYLSAIIKEIPLLLKNLYPNCKILDEDLIPLYDSSFIIDQLCHSSDGGDKWLFHEIFANIIIVLKTNCAPKRDIEIDHMVLQARCNDWLGVFQSLLDIVKGMKLDLLNFKINKSKFLLIKEGKKDLIEYWKSKCINEPLKHFDWLRVDSTKMHNYVAELLISIVMPTSSQPNKKILKTFIPDLRRLNQFREYIQDMLVLNIVLFILFVMAPDIRKRKDILLEGKKRIQRTLQTPTTTLLDISIQIQLVICRVRNKHLESREISLLNGMINNWIDPSHRIYRLALKELLRFFKLSLIKRDAKSIQYFVGDDHFKKEGTVLHPIKSEVNIAIKKLKSYWSLHWSIHSQSSYKEGGARDQMH